MTPIAEIRAEYSLQPFHYSQARTRFRREHCLYERKQMTRDVVTWKIG
jgi:hypothetical protein